MIIKWPLIVIGAMLFVICGIMGMLMRLAVDISDVQTQSTEERQANWFLFGASAIGLAIVITGILI